MASVELLWWQSNIPQSCSDALELEDLKQALRHLHSLVRLESLPGQRGPGSCRWQFFRSDQDAA